jgi:glycerol-3-phosphate dehydrogenase (NAD(P)+)
MRDASAAKRLTQKCENDKYLAGILLDNIEIHDDLHAAVRDANWIIAAVPCNAVPELARILKGEIVRDTILVSGTKGLHSQSGLRASQMWQRDGGLSAEQFVVLSGPNLAREVVAYVPTSSVVASANEQAAQAAQKLFSTPAFRVYTNSDLVGVELGGALKNVVAIAAGISDGLGFGDNSKAAVMTRAWREMTRLSRTHGALESTLFGLSGIGDLIATCTSPYSRNRSLGERLGRGETLEQAQNAIGQVAEGVHTTSAALRLSVESDMDLPVTKQVAAVLFEGREPSQAVAELMGREGCSELL